jgi:hypothetical protein
LNNILTYSNTYSRAIIQYPTHFSFHTFDPRFYRNH